MFFLSFALLSALLFTDHARIIGEDRRLATVGLPDILARSCLLFCSAFQWSDEITLWKVVCLLAETNLGYSWWQKSLLCLWSESGWEGKRGYSISRYLKTICFMYVWLVCKPLLSSSRQLRSRNISILYSSDCLWRWLYIHF